MLQVTPYQQQRRILFQALVFWVIAPAIALSLLL